MRSYTQQKISFGANGGTPRTGGVAPTEPVYTLSIHRDEAMSFIMRGLWGVTWGRVPNPSGMGSKRSTLSQKIFDIWRLNELQILVYFDCYQELVIS